MSQGTGPRKVRGNFSLRYLFLAGFFALGTQEGFAEPLKRELSALFPTLAPSVTSTFKSTNRLLDDADYKFLHSSCSTYSNIPACNGKVAFGVIPAGSTGVPDAHVALNRMSIVTPNGSRTYVDIEIQDGKLILDSAKVPRNGIGIVRIGYFYGSSAAPLSACSTRLYLCGGDVKSCPKDDPAPTCFPLMGKSTPSGCVPPTGTACEDLKGNICSGVNFYDGCGGECGPTGTKTCTTPACTARIITHAIGNPSAPGTPDGFIVLSASGGSGSFTFTLDPATGTQSTSGNLRTFAGLSGSAVPGKKYTVKASDTADATCSTSVDYLLTEPVPCTLNFIAKKKDPTTDFKPNGQIVASYSGANGAVSYSLSPEIGTVKTETNQVTFDGLSASQAGTTYKVTLQDSVCSKSQDVFLKAPPGGEYCKIPGSEPYPFTLYDNCSACPSGYDTGSQVSCRGTYVPSGGGKDDSINYYVKLHRCKYSDGTPAQADCTVNKPDPGSCEKCSDF